MDDNLEPAPGADGRLATDTAALTAYDALRLFSDTECVETQMTMLRQLEAADVPENQLEGLHELQRRHFDQLLRLRRDGRRNDVERISERRSQVRARGREKWRATDAHDGISIVSVQERFPGLYQQQAAIKTPARGQTATRPPAQHAQREARLDPPSVQESAQRAMQNTILAGGNARGRVGMAPPADPQPLRRPAAPQPEAPPLSAPQRTLSELLKRKSSERTNEDGDETNPYSHRMPPRNIRPESAGQNPFQTAGDKLQRDRVSGQNATDSYNDDGVDRFKRNGRGFARQAPRSGSYHPANPHLLFGADSAGGVGDGDDLDVNGAIRKKFVSPIVRPGEERGSGKPHGHQAKPNGAAVAEDDEDIDPRLRSCDPELIAKIEMEIVDNGDPITFDDIAGLQFAKKCVNELVIWPMARPDIFTGLRALPKGLLLFGPPGTGKTLIGKAIASQSGATFFSISASSLTSKWIGEGEKLVRTLFAVAAVKQPSVIFIDEIDSLLTQRSSEENEASRRMKTEFLVQLDGAGTKAKDVILVVGATNRPQELDEAARRRFVKRLYIPLPAYEARMDLINRLLKGNSHDLVEQDLKFIADNTTGYSGADVRALCTEAAMGPIRSCADIQTMDASSVRPINLEDFNEALRGVRSSVAAKDLDFYKAWNEEFGSFAFVGHEG